MVTTHASPGTMRIEDDRPRGWTQHGHAPVGNSRHVATCNWLARNAIGFIERARGALLLLLVVVGITTSAAAAKDAPAMNDDAIVRALVEGYMQHRERFQAFHCRFAVTFGEADNSDDALVGKLSIGGEPPRNYQCTWIIDEEREFYRMACDGPLKIVPISQTEGMANCSTLEYLASAEFSAQFTFGAVLLLGPGENQGILGPFYTPFSLGMMGAGESSNPYSIAVAALSEHRAHYEGQQVVDGRTLHVVSVRITNPAETVQMYLDPEHGYLPMRFIRDYGHSKSIGVIVEVVDCGEGKWFPRRVIKVSTPQADGTRHKLTLIDVSAIELGKPPDESEFAFEVPAHRPFTYHSAATGQRARNFPEARRVHVNDLPALAAAIVGNSVAPAAAAPRGAPWLPWLLIGGNVVVLAAIGLWLAMRRRRP